ncbi:MAG TPA: hypothetical protein VFD63_16510 [Pyrinomonadaceae bacterium]|nr:hypothetical protein [Pyrinomonadaceae bacterium]
MTRNQKIALGCGGAGCLGLIVVVIVGVLIYAFIQRENRFLAGNYNNNYNFNVRSNSNSNSNSTSNSNSDSNDNSSSSSSGLSEDDKHKLYQAAGVTGDAELVRRVSIKIGLMGEDYTPSPEFESFIKEHFNWAVRNAEFIQSINSKEKAIAYVNDHIDD